MGDGTCFRPTIGDRLRFGPALGNGLGSGRRWGMALVRAGAGEWPWFEPILAEGERLTVIYITVDCDDNHRSPAMSIATFAPSQLWPRSQVRGVWQSIPTATNERAEETNHVLCLPIPNSPVPI